MRSFDRDAGQMRPITLTPNVSRHAEGSCLIECGHTKVLCTASIDDRTPRWLRDTGKGWVTAEYGMLPRSTNSRMPREAVRGKQSGRTQEIQRLIGRSLRASVDLTKVGERQIVVDCDVIEADGGTRTASITGGYVALHLALQSLVDSGALKDIPVIAPIAAISCGIVGGVPLLDLDYVEDSGCEVDANFIMTGGGNIVEIQATGEESTYSEEEFMQLLTLAKIGVKELNTKQEEAIRSAQ